MEDNKENLRSVSNMLSPIAYFKRRFFRTDNSFKQADESSVMETASLWHQQSENTFETIERMCNKTLSDPDNTIHEFLANWEKKSSCSSKTDDESVALNRLFEEFGIDENETKLNNQTRLSDIEPPSCLWENSALNNESIAQTSPIKMVGLLRPSTILEESGTDSLSNANSFMSTHRLDTTSSGPYETATEMSSSLSSGQTNRISANTHSGTSNKSGDSSGSKAEAKNYFELFPLKKVSLRNKFSEPKVYNKAIFLNGMGGSRNASFKDISNEKFSLSADSLDKPRYKRSDGFLEDSLETNDFQNQQRKLSSISADIKDESSSHSSLNNDSSVDESSIITVSDDEGEATSDNLNKGFVQPGSDQLETSSSFSAESSGLNVSHEFNNTLEEIEYIMKQGMKYLANKQKEESLEQLQTPRKQKISTPAATPKTPCTVIKKPKPISNKAHMPIANSRLNPVQRTKSTSRFDHIMSPIHAYIHDTPKSPITSSMKPTQSLFESKFGRSSGKPRNKVLTSQDELKVSCSLPRKAYVSAEYNHIVDQRSPVSIPGGDKIHKYLESAKLPAVLRHEGKFRTNYKQRENDNLNKTKGSLADFSMASGDMSILLLRDAKGFPTK